MSKPYLNLGCGRIILPGPRPVHHSLIEPAIYDYPLWVNADRNAEPGVDAVVDLFTYPWPWADNSFDAALLTHIAEHIPHQINAVATPAAISALGQQAAQARAAALATAQDGWYAFMAELWRVLTPGAIAHILSPYGWSQGAITDPTHTRLITEHTWTHSLQPDPNSPFAYETLGLNLRLASDVKFAVTPLWDHLTVTEADTPEVAERKTAALQRAFQTQINVAYEHYARLEAVK